MTTVYKKIKQCSICGSENEYTEIGSTNAFGSADLDTRPPEMQRSTMFAWIQRCKKCGYCGSDVSESIQGTKEVVNGEEYKGQLNDPEYTEQANSFLCKAIIERVAKDYAEAAWAQIHAAWSCDDSGNLKQAKACRQKAVQMILLAEKHNQPIAGEDGAATAILVDLLRRAGQPDQARKELKIRRAGIVEDIIGRVLDFQITLIEKGDVSCHTIAEALGEEE